MFDFFFQAEDGIRAHCVTGVQTCALPISALELDLKGLADHSLPGLLLLVGEDRRDLFHGGLAQGSQLLLRFLAAAIRSALKIGRASCRESVYIWGGAGVTELKPLAAARLA